VPNWVLVQRTRVFGLDTAPCGIRRRDHGSRIRPRPSAAGAVRACRVHGRRPPGAARGKDWCVRPRCRDGLACRGQWGKRDVDVIVLTSHNRAPLAPIRRHTCSSA